VTDEQSRSKPSVSVGAGPSVYPRSIRGAIDPGSKAGTCDVKLALPVPPNEQAPHTQDEIYVIARGRGVLLHDGKRDSFEAGDLLFVAAGIEHRFEAFTEDFAIWRVFYGAEGGEIPA